MRCSYGSGTLQNKPNSQMAELHVQWVLNCHSRTEVKLIAQRLGHLDEEEAQGYPCRSRQEGLPEVLEKQVLGRFITVIMAVI